MQRDIPLMNQNLWENYGFLSNPFDTNPLSFDNNTLLPISKAIVGRGFETNESKLLYNILRNSGGGRVIVEGNIGLGKTTFVNYHRYLWEQYSTDKLLSTQGEISIDHDWKLTHLLLNSLAMLTEKLILIKGKREISNLHSAVKKVYFWV